jgi:hypothetical protein
MDAATGSPEVAIFLHEVYEHADGPGREVDVAIKREKESVLRDNFFAFQRK